MARHKNPRLGKGWIHLGLINVRDVAKVEALMKKNKVPIKITPDHYHATSDPKHKLFKELFVANGYRREAMRHMKMLFGRPQEEA